MKLVMIAPMQLQYLPKDCRKKLEMYWKVTRTAACVWTTTCHGTGGSCNLPSTGRLRGLKGLLRRVPLKKFLDVRRLLKCLHGVLPTMQGLLELGQWTASESVTGSLSRSVKFAVKKLSRWTIWAGLLQEKQHVIFITNACWRCDFDYQNQQNWYPSRLPQDKSGCRVMSQGDLDTPPAPRQRLGVKTTPSRWWWNTGKCTWLAKCAIQIHGILTNASDFEKKTGTLIRHHCSLKELEEDEIQRGPTFQKKLEPI